MRVREFRRRYERNWSRANEPSRADRYRAVFVLPRPTLLARAVLAAWCLRRGLGLPRVAKLPVAKTEGALYVPVLVVWRHRAFFVRCLGSFGTPPLPRTVRALARRERRLLVGPRPVSPRGHPAELAARFHPGAIGLMYWPLAWYFARVTREVRVDEGELVRVRETLSRKPVVFVAAHRSHLDYLAIPAILLGNDTAPPFIAAGLNLDRWPVGPLLRAAGAFFIRRSFRGDEAYRAAVAAYVATVLRRGTSLLLFLEGSRSRTGKLLEPRHGLVKMVLEAGKDVAFVPVSLSYGEVPERAAYAAELRGERPPRPAWLGGIGVVEHRFGEPVPPGELTVLVRDLGRRIEALTPAKPRSIVAGALLASDSLAWEELRQTCAELGLSSGVDEAVAELEALELVAEQGGRLFGPPARRLELAYFRNQAMHLYCDRAVAGCPELRRLFRLEFLFGEPVAAAPPVFRRLIADLLDGYEAVLERRRPRLPEADNRQIRKNAERILAEDGAERFRAALAAGRAQPWVNSSAISRMDFLPK